MRNQRRSCAYPSECERPESATRDRAAVAAGTNHKTRNPRAQEVGMSNYLVAMEAAWLVRDVEDVDDAIGVAVSSAGKRLNEADKEYVDVEVGVTGCPACGEPFDSAFIAADTALVGLLLEIDVFNADSVEHASRIAKSEVGGALRDVPLTVIDVIEEPDDEERET